MKSLAKITLASSVVFSSVVGLGLVNSDNTHTQAQAAETPYYNYEGYTSASSNFVLDKDFINSLKYDNLNINGYKITGTKSNDGKEVNVNDQTFYGTMGKKADSVDFKLDGKTVSKSDLVKTYGEPSESPSNTPHGSSYSYKIGDKLIQFYINDGYVTEVQINS